MKVETNTELFTNRTIVFATDFLESSRLALDYAIGFAHRYKATIIMAHAIELSQPAIEAEMLSHRKSVLRLTAEERLEALAQGVRRLGIETLTHTSEGQPADVLIDIARAAHADMLVLGTHGIHRGLGHLLLGSNVEKILIESPCPTLTVGRHVMSGVDLDLAFKEVLYVTDFAPASQHTASYALLLARDFQAPLDICQLLPDAAQGDAFLRQKLAQQFEDEMRAILPDADQYLLKPGVQINPAAMAEQVLERAQQNSAGLIVLGTRPESFLGRHLHTSFGYQLLSKATCPIFTVPLS